MRRHWRVPGAGVRHEASKPGMSRVRGAKPASKGITLQGQRGLVKAQDSPAGSKLKVQIRVRRVGAASSSAAGKEVKPATRPEPAEGESWAASPCTVGWGQNKG